MMYMFTNKEQRYIRSMDKSQICKALIMILPYKDWAFSESASLGGGCFLPALVKFDPDNLGQWNLADW